MNTEPAQAYGLWWLVVINSLVFIIFAFSFAKPQSARDWRSLGAFSAFIVALFTEMYGFPLTIYLLSGWLGSRYPGIDFLTHDAGHLFETLFGWRADWPASRPWAGGVIAVIGAMVITAWSEWYNVYRMRAWSYTSDMPTIYGVGLSPLLQWLIIPPVIVVAHRALLPVLFGKSGGRHADRPNDGFSSNKWIPST